MSYVQLKNREVRSATERQCGWCPEKIAPKEPHRYRAYKWEGDFTTDRLHLECYQAACDCDWNEGEGFDAHMFKRGTSEERNR